MPLAALKIDNATLTAENEMLRARLEEAEETIRAIRGGEIDAVVVEENEQAAIKHLIAEELLSQYILEQVGDAVVICNTQGVILRCSRAVKDLCTVPTQDKLFDEIFSLFLAENQKSPLTFRTLLTRDRMRGLEVIYNKGTGEDMYLLLGVSVLRDADSSIRGVVITLTDISDRKRAEALLRLTDKRKDEFLATLAHELRNPLAPLHNALTLLQMAQGNATIQQQARDIMARQLKQMVRLVDDLLDVSRITRNNIELRKETIAFAAIIKNALEISQPLIEAKKHTLSVTLPKTQVYLETDPVRAAQIFSNLLNNAAKYTPAGGKIWVNACMENTTLTVSIRDNGIGIAPKMLPHIFDMFIQADNSLERSQGGLGIGLTLVKNLLTLHNGSIDAESAGLGKGSEFTVRLPVSVASSSEKADVTLTSPVTGLNILVADDNEASARTIGCMLELMGHTPTLLFEGTHVVETAKKMHPDVVLLDIGMPGMNGYDICRTLRATPGFSQTVLIAQTGWGQEQDRIKAKEAGFTHHLIKPVDSLLLQKMLAEPA